MEMQTATAPRSHGVAVVINADCEITNVGGRAIYSTSDISFGPGVIEDVIVYPE